MNEFNLSQLITLRSSVAEKMFDADEKQNKNQVDYYLKIVDMLSDLINKEEEGRKLEKEADDAWKESTYYEKYKDNKAVEEGWKQNWMKVNAEEELLGLIMSGEFIKNENK